MKILKLLTILLLTVTVFGQTTNEIVVEKPHIEVVGMAEKEIMPDEIYIGITIRDRYEGREKITIEKQESDLKNALESIDVSLDNLTMSDVDANYVRVKWKKKDVVAKTEYVLKVGNALTVGKVFEQLDELKIMDANISKVSHSKILEFKKEVRIMAIKAAKEKATYLLEAIGEEIGKPLKVYELKSHYIEDASFLNVKGKSESIYIDGVKATILQEKVVQFKKIKLQASISVKFEIK